MLKRIICGTAIALALFGGSLVHAAEQRLIAVVNDQPVTSRDIDQQIKLNQILGGRSSSSRKQILNDIINQVVKIEEAKRYRLQPSDAEVDTRIGDIAKGLSTSMEGLEDKLSKQGIGMASLRQYVSAQISFARLIKFRYKADVQASDAEVDRKMSQIKSDLNGRIEKAMAGVRSVTVASLMEINFPVEAVETGGEQLLQSRAAEANQFISRFKGCKSAREAASGIFNVKVGKTFDADFSKLPKPLQAVMQQKGVGSAIGPMRSKSGIQVIAYCGQRRIDPKRPQAQLPSRAQVVQAVLNEKFETVEQKYLGQMRKNAIIEYRDASFAQ